MPSQDQPLKGTPHKSKGQKRDEMARKRDERVVRNAYRKDLKMKKALDSYLADDENYGSFANQLTKLGLHLRDIPGDGNCLFRALGDQLEGHGRNHYKHRLDVVNYMLEHRDDFEPFVEDDVPFDRHIAMLKKMGTYAGNDAIVAFARLYGLNVVIHQLNSPIWTIQGAKDPVTARELHISYHNGDHYSSVRRIGDNLEAPANVKIKPADLKTLAAASKNGTSKQYQQPKYNQAQYTAHHSSQESPRSSHYKQEDFSGYDSDYDNVPSGSVINGDAHGIARVSREPMDIEDEVERLTGCLDKTLIRQTLVDQCYDVDSTVQVILHLMINSPTSRNSSSSPQEMFSKSSMGYATNDSGIWSDSGTGTRIFGSSGSNGVAADDTPIPAESHGTKPKSKMNTRELKKEKKMEKKKKQEERHRQKYRDSLRGSEVDGAGNYNEVDLARDVGMLKI